MSTKQNRGTILSWHRSDIEQKIGFSGGRFTKVNAFLTLLLGCGITVAVYAFMVFAARSSKVSAMFLDRGFTPYVMTILFSWSVVIILFKWSKLRFQKRTLERFITPEEPDFVLSSATVQQVLDQIYKVVDDPKAFVLFNRVQVALSNLRNLGRVTDVDEMFRSQADIDESQMETSYSLLRGFIWAIPVLGFIGTVMGLSIAIGGFGDVLAETTNPEKLASSLKVVTGGLSTAFETTLVALLFALALQLTITFLHKDEEEFLDDCSEYCQRNIVSKLKIMPFEMEDAK